MHTSAIVFLVITILILMDLPVWLYAVRKHSNPWWSRLPFGGYAMAFYMWWHPTPKHNKDHADQ